VDLIEAEAEASTELGHELTGDSLQQKFKALEAGSGTDNALAELKAKMGLAAPEERAALPSRTEGSGETASESVGSRNRGQ
jgi:phage shock protein A